MLTVLITCENRGRWTLKARPGETASARDSLDQLAAMVCVDAETAATVRRVFDALDDHTMPLADTPHGHGAVAPLPRRGKRQVQGR
jgi:hypothetical protein